MSFLFTPLFSLREGSNWARTQLVSEVRVEVTLPAAFHLGQEAPSDSARAVSGIQPPLTHFSFSRPLRFQETPQGTKPPPWVKS